MIFTQLELFEWFTLELIEFRVFNQSFCYIFYNCKNSFLLVHSLRNVFFTLYVILEFYKFRNVLLKTFNFFFEIIYLSINNIKSSNFIASIFNFNLHQHFKVLIFFCQCLSLIQSFLSLSTYFNSSIYIENRISVILRVRFLY